MLQRNYNFYMAVSLALLFRDLLLSLFTQQRPPRGRASTIKNKESRIKTLVGSRSHESELLGALAPEEPPALRAKHVGSCSRHPWRRWEELVGRGGAAAGFAQAHTFRPAAWRSQRFSRARESANWTPMRRRLPARRERRRALGMVPLPLSAYLSPALG